jgi:hypothetical protein
MVKLNEMNSQIQDIIKSFESSSKSRRTRYTDLLAHIYMTFDKKISLCKTDKEMNKYKKMRNSVLKYIVVNEREITNKICK